jgi:hypothetical protein
VSSVSAAFGVATFLLSAGGAMAATTSCNTVAACVMGTNSSSGPGVGGTSKSGFGLSGISTSNHGVNGTSASSFGVVGITTENATSTSNARAGVYGEDLSTNKNKYNSGVAGTSTYGYGGSFTSKNGIGLYANGIKTSGGLNSVGDVAAFDNTFDAPPPASEYPTSGVSAAITGTSTYSFNAQYFGTVWNGLGCDVEADSSEDKCRVTSTIDARGQATFTKVTSNATTVLRTKSTTGKDLTSYGARTSSPTLEDFGQGSLRQGVAHIALEPAYSSTIDPRSYMVFITPQGDSKGLYTMAITPTGFDVRENGGGRSTLTFSYRIVGHPLDTTMQRLPLMSPSRVVPKTARPAL